ncbi:MAG: hypothetical protein QXU99_04705 [Candidatus Bathyarchaeia archaeon]
MEKVKKLVRNLSAEDDKGYLIAVFIALLFAFILLASYYDVLKPPEKQYTTIYVLDTQKRAIEYAETLVINKNNTFNALACVENHMNVSKNFTVMMKITNEIIHKLPLTTDATAVFSKMLEKGEIWEIPFTVTLNDVGNYAVVFELWMDDESGILKYTDNSCILNVEVTS